MNSLFDSSRQGYEKKNDVLKTSLSTPYDRPDVNRRSNGRDQRDTIGGEDRSSNSGIRLDEFGREIARKDQYSRPHKRQSNR